MHLLPKLAFASLIPNLHYRVNTRQPEIYLTFDDGPSDGTERVLDVLAREQVLATFFVLGRRIAGREHLLRQIHEKGHTIGTHSHSHRSPREQNLQNIVAEQEQCTAALREVLPEWDGALTRPPYGHLSREYLRFSRKQGIRVIMWSKDSRDYQAESADQVADSIGQPRRGDIILFHDQFEVTADALERLIPEYRARGYRFAPLPSSVSGGRRTDKEVAAETF